MRYSHYFPKTVKDAPKYEVAVNAKLLLRGGFIDKLMAGSYTLLPLGRLVERKIEDIIREEMNATGAMEMLMPLLHPKDIWNETGRWDTAAEVMYQFAKDEREYALSFTHEEIVMDIIRKHITSYKDLPVKVYQFSTKFRNEPRAKSGILRGREFLMKDLYSAHTTREDLMKYYWEVADSYLRIFKRLGLEVKITEASGGVFTEEHTHEFQVPCETGEDTIYWKDDWKFAKNKEVMAEEELQDASLSTSRAIEVGNIFPLGLRYAEKMGVTFMDESGTRRPIWFASYGIGPTRVMGTIVEVSHDDQGIIWPESVAPYQVHLIGIMNNELEIREKAEKAYRQLQEAGIDVLYDDRENAGAGEKFADSDLVGIPVRLVVSSKSGDKIEWKKRNEKGAELLSLEKVISKLKPH